MAYRSFINLSFFSLLCLSYNVLAEPTTPSLPVLSKPSRHSLEELANRLSKLEQTDSGSHFAAKDDEFYNFVSRPDIGAPRWDVKIYDKDAISPGYWFTAPYAKLDQSDFKKWNGPHIYDGTGELVWSGAPMFKHYNTYDFRTVEVHGQQMASLIFRKDEDGVIFDNNYQVRKTVDMVGYLPNWLLDALDESERLTNMHDFNVIADGQRALMLTKVFENATIEESRAIGFDGNCTAKWQGFKEIDLATGEPVFEWSAHGHIGLDESTKYARIEKDCNGHLGQGGWDILHLNAIDKFPDGDYFISSRHTDTLYKISHVDGSIVWRLGGVKSDFEFLNKAKFSRQHHARVHQQNSTHTIVSVFDNAKGDGRREHPSNTNSRGLKLLLHTAATPMTAEILGAYEHPQGRYTSARGSMQVLDNDNAFVCWSGSTLQSEHTSDGRIVLEASFKLEGANSYRSYKFPWVGKPTAPPDVHSVAGGFGGNGTSTLVHVSWNGATEVSSWNMYRTDAEGKYEQLIASTKRQGFETVLSYRGYASFVILEAVDSNGEVLGRSNVQKTIPPANPEDPAVIEETQWLQEQASEPSLFTAIAVLHNPLFAFLFGASACAAAAAVMWIFLRKSKKNGLWPSAQDQIYERLAEADVDGKDFGDETLVDDESDVEEKHVGKRVSVTIRESLPC